MVDRDILSLLEDSIIIIIIIIIIIVIIIMNNRYTGASIQLKNINIY